MKRKGEDFEQGLGWWHIIQADVSNGGLVADPPQAALDLAEAASARQARAAEHMARDLMRAARTRRNYAGRASARAARCSTHQRTPTNATIQYPT